MVKKRSKLLTIQESDGNPTISNVTTLIVTNGALTDVGGGVASLSVSGGGGSPLTVREIDGTPSVASVGTINVTNGKLTDNGGGNVTIDVAGSIPTSRSLNAVSPITGGGDLSADRNFGFDQSVALGNNARISVNKNSGATVGTRRRINLIEGSNITLTIADDSGNEEVDITIAASAGTVVVSNTEVNIASLPPKLSGSFDITTSGLTIGKPVLINQAVGPYTGKGTRSDEAEMDVLTATAEVISATIIRVYWHSIYPVLGNFKFNYLIGA